MARYKKLGYVALNVTDVSRSREFYETQLGLQFSAQGEGGEVYLRCSADHHKVILYPSTQPGLRRVGWEMENDAELAAMRLRLQEAGQPTVDVPEAETARLVQGPSFRTVEPSSGAVFEYYSIMQQYGRAFQPTVAQIARLGHVVLRTPDLPASAEYCTSVLNFRLSDAVQGRVHFMRCFPNPYHHSLGVATSAQAGLHHVNFMVTNIDDIGKAMARFKRAGIEVVFGPGRHPPSESIFLYFLDPDGMTVEYSFGMEEFAETGARKPRLLAPIPESIDYWGCERDPRTSTFGSIDTRILES